MKQVVFLVALLGAFGEVCAAAAPPYVDGSTYLEQQARLSNSSHGQPQPTFISTAPKADNLDPVYDAFRKETSPSFVNNGTMCLFLIVLEKVVLLSLGLCGVQDSTIEDNCGHQVESHNTGSRKTSLAENKEKLV